MYLVPYHHGNLRAALVDAAVELADKEGPDAVVLREVSRRVGVSHNAAYRHVADREELLRAVSARALTEFGRLMALRIGAVPGRGKKAARARFEACGRAYVEFAVTHPGLFRCCGEFPLGDVNPDDPDVTHAYVQLSQRLDELVAVGTVTPERRQGGEIAAWSAVHGYALLVTEGPLQLATAAVREQGLDALIRVVGDGI
jgi:AcrR family transcriptional regulator